ncbi:MAG TPA: GNAT family N-acetyltransferase [Bacillus bacterium]|nr:GNAT family N-acetyltransferase [Bacillus sp. (in: firmicutes)]
MEFPILETDRLVLREIIEDDAGDLFKNFSNKEIINYYGSELMVSREEAFQLIHSFRNNFLEKRGFRWGIQIKGEKEVIGTIGFHAWSPKNKRAEIGYELHPDYWRKGFAMEAIKAVVDFGYSTMELNRIGAVVFLENRSSNELLKKMAFHKEGILRKYIVQNGLAYDVNSYSLLR